MSAYPPVTIDDPEYSDDPSIPNHEVLWRGLLGKWLPSGPTGPVSSAAFKGWGQDAKIRRHISTYRKSLGQYELPDIWKKLPISVALCDIQAAEVRGLEPEIVGICDVTEGLSSHTRIIRNRKVNDNVWQVVTVILAEAAQVSLLRPANT